MQLFEIEARTETDDGIGGISSKWTLLTTVKGFIDLLAGDDSNMQQGAFIEESTHILIIPKFTNGITDDMRVVGPDKRIYGVTYSDNPVGINHHNEIYCKFEGVKHGTGV